jgi:hypothetical protein
MAFDVPADSAYEAERAASSRTDLDGAWTLRTSQRTAREDEYDEEETNNLNARYGSYTTPQLYSGGYKPKISQIHNDSGRIVENDSGRIVGGINSSTQGNYYSRGPSLGPTYPAIASTPQYPGTSPELLLGGSEARSSYYPSLSPQDSEATVIRSAVRPAGRETLNPDYGQYYQAQMMQEGMNREGSHMQQMINANPNMLPSSSSIDADSNITFGDVGGNGSPMNPSPSMSNGILGLEIKAT